MGNWQRFSVLKDIDCLYAYQPEKSLHLDPQKSNSSSGGDQISGGYIWQEVILCTPS